MKTVIITQARLSSSRLPLKVLQKIGGLTLIEHHVNRLLKSSKADEVVVATTFEEGINELMQLFESSPASCFQGSLADVLDRYYQAALYYKADWVVRVTSDCPLVDSDLIDSVIDFTQDNDLDYCSNQLEGFYPDGMDVEVFKINALKKAWSEATLASEREHVTPYIINNSTFRGKSTFRSMSFECPFDFSSVRLTVDEQIDLDTIGRVYRNVGPNGSWDDYVKFYLMNFTEMGNAGIERNEGYKKSFEAEK